MQFLISISYTLKLMKQIIYNILFSFFLILSPLSLGQVKADSVHIVFKTFIALNDNFLQSIPKNSPTNHFNKEYRLKVEEFSEDKLNPILSDAQKIICRNNDSKLLAELFKVQIISKNSANELPAYYLGKIFLFNPELFESVYNNLENDDKLIILDFLEFGFENVTYEYGALIKKLKSNIKGSK